MSGFLSEQPNSNPHYLNRLIKLLNHFISIEPSKKTIGFECHHIVPRSWKPEWVKEPNNLLKVPTKVHYVIHHLMWRAFPEDRAMQRSFWLTCNGQQKQKITAKVFENAKKDLKHSDETKQKMSASLKGKNIGLHLGKKHSDETKQKMSIAQKR